MAMGPWITLASALAALNVVLLGVLTVVWVRNYRTFRTPLVLGLVAFAVVMLVENAAAVYFFFSMGMLYSGDPVAQQFVAAMRALEMLALVFLTFVSLK